MEMCGCGRMPYWRSERRRTAGAMSTSPRPWGTSDMRVFGRWPSVTGVQVSPRSSVTTRGGCFSRHFASTFPSYGCLIFGRARRVSALRRSRPTAAWLTTSGTRPFPGSLWSGTRPLRQRRRHSCWRERSWIAHSPQPRRDGSARMARRPVGAEYLLPHRRVESQVARVGVVRQFSKDHPAADVVQIDSHVVGAFGEFSGDLEHAVEVWRRVALLANPPER